MKDILEYKNSSGGITDIDEKNGIVTGYLSSFDNVDSHNDIIVKGAYKKTISERKNDIFFLNNHNWAQPHGKFTLLEERPKGLYFESTPLVKGVSYSDDLIKLYTAGIVKEHSVGYLVKQKDYDQKGNRIIKEMKLFEGSNVTLGSNSNTPFTGLKSLTIQDINKDCALLYKAIRNGNFTDETFTMLEFALKDLQFKAYELGKKALEAESQKSTHKNVEKSQIDIIKEFTKTLNLN